MKKILILSLMALMVSFAADAKKKTTPQTDREYWAELAYKTAAPILENMSKGELRKNMPVEFSPKWDNRDPDVTYMEAFGRLMSGITPWLALPDDDTAEGKQRKQLREWALASYAHSVDPASPDYLKWKGPSQSLVDAAYIALSFLRAPEIWKQLDKTTQERYVKEFQGLRRIGAPYNNWLLFRATIEAFLASAGAEYDNFVLNLTVRKMNEWYLGDGWYSDGPEFSFDYYDSFVIHPMLLATIEAMQGKAHSEIPLGLAVKRMHRYDRLIERMISPEATFPAVGRSVTYRMAAFQTLALSSWRYGLHADLSYGQVRNALTSVMKRMFSMPGTFNEQGYLSLGFVGAQPNIADYYSNTGSMYLTANVFLPLGLKPDHAFWTAPAEKWTQQKAWGGEPFLKDYHESIRYK